MTVPRRAGGRGDTGPRLPRAPRTAAVAITARIGASERDREAFSDRVSAAMTAIDVAELGITATRPRRAATGGLVFEVPGARGAQQAAALRARLVERLGDPEIKIRCPQKSAELRVCGLTELVAKDAVRRALAAQGRARSGT